MSNSVMTEILPMETDATVSVNKNLDGSAVVGHQTSQVYARSLSLTKFSFPQKVL